MTPERNNPFSWLAEVAEKSSRKTASRCQTNIDPQMPVPGRPAGWGDQERGGASQPCERPDRDSAGPAAGRTPMESDQPKRAPMESDQPKRAPMESDQPKRAPMESDQPKRAPTESHRPKGANMETLIFARLCAAANIHPAEYHQFRER